MAGKKKVYKRKTRRYRRKTNKSTKLSSTVAPKAPSTIVDFGYGFPKKALVRHRYVDNVTINSTSGVLTNYVMCLNGCHDPNISQGGHQPLFYDELISRYNHYHVIGSKMTVRLIPMESNTVPCAVSLTFNDDNTVTPTTIGAIQEQTGASFSILGSGGDASITLSLNYSAKKYFGKSVLSNNNLQGESGSNPFEGYFGVITLVGADGATSVSVIAQIVIEYIVIWHELKDTSGS